MTLTNLDSLRSFGDRRREELLEGWPQEKFLDGAISRDRGRLKSRPMKVLLYLAKTRLMS